jgi:hypothetical protein
MGNVRTPFWQAFLAGLAAPTGLYAAPPPYSAYTGDYSVGHSFAIVGVYLSLASSQVLSVRPPEQAPSISE